MASNSVKNHSSVYLLKYIKATDITDEANVTSR